MPDGQGMRTMHTTETKESTGDPTNSETSDTSTGGSTTKETRYELGFFVRRVETQSETPPAYPNPKPDDT